MNVQIQELLNSGATLLVLLAIAVLVGFVMKKIREYNVTLKGLFGNNPITDQIIDEIYTMLTETVTDITLSVSEKYKNDGAITKEEMALIKQEAIEIALKRLNATQNKAIEVIYGDVMSWLSEQIGKEVTKIASGE